MISKRIISEIRELHLDKNRKEQQLFIAEGEKVVDELLRSGIKIKLLAFTEDWKMPDEVNKRETEHYTVTENELLKISLQQKPNKVLAVAEIPAETPIDFSENNGLILLLDGIRDPGNLGTMIRTADWFGVKHICCSPDCVDAYNPKVVQSAMGSLFRVKLHYNDSANYIKNSKSGGYQLVGASADGTPYAQLKNSGKIMLVIGSESHGISEEILSSTDMKAAIPRAGGSHAESLNAGVAAAILLAHFSKV